MRVNRILKICFLRFQFLRGEGVEELGPGFLVMGYVLRYCYYSEPIHFLLYAFTKFREYRTGLGRDIKKSRRERLDNVSLCSNFTLCKMVETLRSHSFPIWIWLLDFHDVLRGKIPLTIPNSNDLMRNFWKRKCRILISTFIKRGPYWRRTQAEPLSFKGRRCFRFQEKPQLQVSVPNFWF